MKPAEVEIINNPKVLLGFQKEFNVK